MVPEPLITPKGCPTCNNRKLLDKLVQEYGQPPIGFLEAINWLRSDPKDLHPVIAFSLANCAPCQYNKGAALLQALSPGSAKDNWTPAIPDPKESPKQ